MSNPPDEPDSDRCPDAADAPPPREVAELVNLLLDYARRATGFELDLTADTLPVLDHYVGMVHADLALRPELLPVVAPAVAAYFGEVVRTELPSFWDIRGPDPSEYYLCLRPVFLAMSPLGVAYDVLTHGSCDEGPSPELLLLPSERQMVARRLNDLPRVAPGEYYLLSTRLEVIEIAAETLRGQRLLHNQEYFEYGLAEYERLLGLDGRIDA